MSADPLREASERLTNASRRYINGEVTLSADTYDDWFEAYLRAALAAPVEADAGLRGSDYDAMRGMPPETVKDWTALILGQRALSRPSGSIDVPTLAEAIAAVDIGLPPGNPQRAHWRTSPGQVAHATEVAAEYARLSDEAAS